jgi:hypothetical protein
MTNKYYDAYNAVFTAVQTILSSVSSIKNVVLGEQFRVGSLPMAIINPLQTDITQGAFGALLSNKINFSVIVMIRETEPSNWFTDILSPMGDVVDAILADRTLAGSVKDVIPTLVSPGEIRTQGKLYYGGVIKFQALLQFTP